MSKIYDVIILGAGPAGLAAGLYAGRSRLSTLIIEKGQDGGQIAITDEIENYPGQIVEGESGPSLICLLYTSNHYCRAGPVRICRRHEAYREGDGDDRSDHGSPLHNRRADRSNL